MESIKQTNKSGTERLILLTYKGTLKELLEGVRSNTKEIDFASLVDIGRCSLAIMAATQDEIYGVKIICVGDLLSKEDFENWRDEFEITDEDLDELKNLEKIYAVGHGSKEGLLNFTGKDTYSIDGESLNRTLENLFFYTGCLVENLEVIFTNCYANSVANYIKQQLHPSPIVIYGSKYPNISYAVLAENPTDIVILTSNNQKLNAQYILYQTMIFKRSFNQVNKEYKDIDDICEQLTDILPSKVQAKFQQFDSPYLILLLLKSIAINVVQCEYIVLNHTISAHLSYGLGELVDEYGTFDNKYGLSGIFKIDPRELVQNLTELENKNLSNEKLEKLITDTCKVLQILDLQTRIKKTHDLFKLKSLSVEEFSKEIIEQILQEGIEFQQEAKLYKLIKSQKLLIRTWHSLKQIDNTIKEIREDNIGLSKCINDFVQLKNEVTDNNSQVNQKNLEEKQKEEERRKKEFMDKMEELNNKITEADVQFNELINQMLELDIDLPEFKELQEEEEDDSDEEDIITDNLSKLEDNSKIMREFLKEQIIKNNDILKQYEEQSTESDDEIEQDEKLQNMIVQVPKISVGPDVRDTEGNTWYSVKTIISLIRAEVDEYAKVLDPIRNQEMLKIRVEELNNTVPGTYIIPINVHAIECTISGETNHWVALVVKKRAIKYSTIHRSLRISS